MVEALWQKEESQVRQGVSLRHSAVLFEVRNLCVLCVRWAQVFGTNPLSSAHCKTRWLRHRLWL